jgi:hypothetical protein
LVFRLRKETLHDGQRILILGVGPELRKVEKLIKGNLTEKLEQVTILDLKSHPDFGAESPSSCSNTIVLIRNEVARTGASDVIIAFPRNASDWIGAISSALEDMPLGVWVALDYFDLSLANTYVENLGGLPLLDLRAPALNEYARVLKRVFDLTTASLGFVLLSPLMLVTALIVLIDAGWPIFFLQKRVGENGRLFSMIKFRTMVRDAEKMRSQVEYVDENGALIHKSRNDPRVTGSGRFLRRFSLDE